MPNLTLKNIPDALLDRLREAAAANRRSMNQEVMVRLERSLAADPVGDPHAFLEALRAFRSQCEIAPVTVEILRRAREGLP